MFYLAAFPQFVSFQSAYHLEAFALVSIHAAIMVVWFSAACIVISNIKQLNRDSSLGRWVQYICGGILVAFSCILLTQEKIK